MRTRTIGNGTRIQILRDQVIITYPAVVAAEILREAAMEDAAESLDAEEWIATDAAVRLASDITVIIDSPVRYPGDGDQDEWARLDRVPFV